MSTRRILTIAVVAACRGPAEFVTDDPVDTDIQQSHDSDGSPACAGSLDLTFQDVTTDPIPLGTTWTSLGATWITSSYLASAYQVYRDEAGCVALDAGTLSIDLLPTGCAASAAHFTVTDRCGAACTVVRLRAGDRAVAENHNTSMDEQNFTLTPREPFGAIDVGSLDAALCAVRVDLTAIPDNLRPTDTDSPF